MSGIVRVHPPLVDGDLAYKIFVRYFEQGKIFRAHKKNREKQNEKDRPPTYTHVSAVGGFLEKLEFPPLVGFKGEIKGE